MITVVKTTFNHHTTHKWTFACNKVKWIIFPSQGRKLFSTYFRNLLDCFFSAILYFQQISVKLKSPKEQVMRILLVACRIFCLPLHPGWVVCNISLIALSPYPYPETHSPFITITQLHTIKVFCTYRANPTSFLSLPISSEDPITIYLSTPGIQVIPLCLTEVSDIIDLRLN